MKGCLLAPFRMAIMIVWYFIEEAKDLAQETNDVWEAYREETNASKR